MKRSYSQTFESLRREVDNFPPTSTAHHQRWRNKHKPRIPSTNVFYSLKHRLYGRAQTLLPLTVKAKLFFLHFEAALFKFAKGSKMCANEFALLFIEINYDCSLSTRLMIFWYRTLSISLEWTSLFCFPSMNILIHHR